jgi:hypothetical protein
MYWLLSVLAFISSEPKQCLNGRFEVSGTSIARRMWLLFEYNHISSPYRCRRNEVSAFPLPFHCSIQTLDEIREDEFTSITAIQGVTA